MKTLHILKSEPDETTRTLITAMSQAEETTLFRMYDEKVDYEALVELIFEHDKTVTWW